MNHLNEIKQNYFSHFRDSMVFCGKSLKASFYFLIHAFYPDIFIKHGSTEIAELNSTIVEKYTKYTEYTSEN
jgi:hypothetical protein